MARVFSKISVKRTMAMVLSLFLLFSWTQMASSCRKKVETSELVGQVAKQYYEHLISGQYKDYVDGMYQPDSIPGGYRSQLVDNAKMFMEQQRIEHRGLQNVSVLNVAVDEENQVADVYLRFTYGDGDTEQVLVPMVEHEGIWYMR